MQYIPKQEQRIKIYQKIQQMNSNDEQKQNVFSRANNSQQNPKQNKLDMNMNMNKQFQKKMSTEEVTQLINRLSKNNRKQFDLKMQVRKLMEINIEKKKIIRGKEKVEVRLLQAGRQLEEKKQKMKEKYLEEQANSLQKIPTTNSQKNPKSQEFFHERINHIISEKQQKFHKLDKKYKPKFTPELNTYSLFIADINYGDKDFLQRVQEKQKNKNMKIENLKQELSTKKQEETTFEPKINTKSKSLAKLRHFQQKSKTKQEKRENNANQSSFHPKINNKSQIIVRNKDRKNIVQRLGHESIQESMLKRMQKERKKENQLTFKPKFNKKSLEIAKNKKNQSSQNLLKLDQNEFEQIFIDAENITQFKCPKLFKDCASDESESNSYEEVTCHRIYTNKNSRRTSIE